MISSETITASNVDLSNCDREQIQFPGAILPHGVLLVVKEPELNIIQASENSGEVLGTDVKDLLQHPLTALFDDAQMSSIRERLRRDSLTGPPTRLAVVTMNSRSFDLLAHRYDQVLFLEFEPRPPENAVSVSDLYAELRSTTLTIQSTKTLQEFMDLAVEKIRSFTGFDRVMAYKFLPDGSGWVRSESVIAGQTRYMGLHFPASDVPAPARRIFSLSWLRHQPDIGYTPVPMVPTDNPVTGKPLDMSYAVLRSVSVMYTGYLKNMGTDSSMVMTLLKNGNLWGLIACHHHSGARHIPYEVRLACEFLSNMVSLLIAEMEDREHSEYRLKMKSSQELLLQAMARNGEFANALTAKDPSLLDFVKAGGAAVVTDGRIRSLGHAPSEVEIQHLVAWLSENVLEPIYATDSLASQFAGAADFKDVASGLLALRFAQTKSDYLLWFRPEKLQTVEWAGDPHKPVEFSANGQRLLPRTSFALWRETVQLKSDPWLEIEIQAASDLRAAVLELIIRKAETLAELYESLEKSHIELDAFAYVASHDLKEPLRGIHNYSRFLLEDCADRLGVEDIAKLKSMVRLSERMEALLDSLLRYSRMSRKDLALRECDVNIVIEEVIESLQIRIQDAGTEIRIPRPMPTVTADSVTLSEIFSNLISNAVKYNNKPKKWVEVGFEQAAQGQLIFHVRDNGIGIEDEHREDIFTIFRRLHGQNEFGGGTGAGLTIARKLVERQGGRIWFESSLEQGTTFYFVLPPTEGMSK